MQSNGGLTDARRFHGKDSILSGPAGGIVGMARTCARAGFDRVIGFDMGGTSTDVSHFAGEFEREFETQVAGVRMRAPMMSIHTVAAGGGSILHFDGSRLRVGPDSAGANPGPASYRRGGPLAITDCNVMLGKLQPDHFPRVFGPNADEPLDADVVRERFAAMADAIVAEGGARMTPEAIAEGFIDIAVGNMANAIKKISVQRGHDVTDYVLATFGGAGGQHACLVADALGMTSDVRASARRRAVRVRHGSRGPDGAEGTRRRGAARRRHARDARRRDRRARERRARRARRAGRRARPHRRPAAACTCATQGTDSPLVVGVRRRRLDARRLRGAVSQALLVPDAGPRS